MLLFEIIIYYYIKNIRFIKKLNNLYSNYKSIMSTAGVFAILRIYSKRHTQLQQPQPRYYEQSQEPTHRSVFDWFRAGQIRWEKFTIDPTIISW